MLRTSAMRTVIQTLFQVTARDAASLQARRFMAGYLALGDGLSERDGMRQVKVPSMPGVDDDMRDWSYFMILRHNAIVNRSISAITQQLARGEPLSGEARINPKTDVMPSADCGPEQVEEFRRSVEDHLATVATLGKLRGTARQTHPVFGPCDAHRWHCMFAFHLKIHLPQAAHVAREAGGRGADE